MSALESRYHDGDYLEKNADWHAADAPFKAQWIREVLNRHDISPRKVAEIGCGSGGILVELSKYYPDAYFSGYDISSQAFAIASQKANARIEFFHDDLIVANRRGFDLLMAIDVFEHVPDYIGFIHALKDLAEYKLFHIPLDLSVQGMLRPAALQYSRKVVGHLHYFTKETALATLVDTGFEVIGWQYTHGSEELSGRKLRTRLLNTPRRLLRTVNTDLSVRLFGGSSMMVLTR
jgi:SAM-dependent methyltransferase